MLIFLVVPLSESDREQINRYIVGIAGGDEDALEALYRLTGGRLLSVAVGITGDRHMAEDALQESLIRIVKYAASFKRRENGYGWLCTIVRNVSLTMVASYKPSAPIDEFYNLAASDRTEENAALKIHIENALAALTPPERKLIWLKYYNDMTVRDIAAALNLPRATAGYQLNRAEEKLRAGLREKEPAAPWTKRDE